MSHHLTFDARRCAPRAVRASHVLVLAWSALNATGCGARVEVGEAKKEDLITLPSDEPMDNQPPPANTGGGGGSPPAKPPDCSGADAQSRAVHDAWSLIANEFGPLSGKTLSGYVEGGPDVTLTIDAVGDATLAAGEPAPAPVADESYLCGNGLQNFSQCEHRYRFPPVEGGVYPLHGASFTAGRLIVPLQAGAPYEAWCVLQTPHEADVCFFQIAPLDGFSFNQDEGICTLGGNLVDCGWLELAMLGVCSCTSTACFANIFAEPQDQIDARYDEATGELSGSIILGNGDRFAIHLSELRP